MLKNATIKDQTPSPVKCHNQRPDPTTSEMPQLKTRPTTSESKKVSNDQELIQSDPTSCPQNQKGNN